MMTASYNLPYLNFRAIVVDDSILTIISDSLLRHCVELHFLRTLKLAMAIRFALANETRAKAMGISSMWDHLRADI